MSAGKLRKKGTMKYMHTIGGKPAFYEEGEQLYYANAAHPARLYGSLREIRRNEKRSLAWRKRAGFSNEGQIYGYCLVRP